MKWVFVMGLLSLFLLGCAEQPAVEQKPLEEQSIEEQIQANLPEVCDQGNGEWLEEHRECEGLDQGLCQELGGSFNECASPCRHNPNAEICTQNCVPVCIF